MPRLDIDGVEVLPRISDYVDLYAGRTPDRTAVVSRNRRLSWRELQDAVDACARAYIAQGVRRGDRVAMLSTPRAEFWIAFLAAARIGAIWVGLNPRYTLRECDYVVGDAEPRLLLSLASFEERQYRETVDALRARHGNIVAVAVDADIPGALPYRLFLDDGSTIDTDRYRQAIDSVETTDPALIVYTSGSTGQPKGAVLTHYALSFGATLQTRHFRVDRPAIVVSFPVNHVASVADTCATTLVRGGKIVFQEQFDPVASVEATVAERCTIMGGVPTMYQLQASAPGFDEADLSAVELMLWGGAAMPEGLIHRLGETGTRLMTAYGMTETATHVTYTDEDAGIDILAGTVGRPDPRCRLRIATEDGGASSIDNTGEVQLEADFLMTGYWNRPEASRASFTDDGWFRTGDIGYLRDDGNLVLVGRMSDMFKSGGYNVYPREIETVLEQHPGVALAAVVAVPDELYQEVGCAWIRAARADRPDARELDAWCRERLANYKVPKQFRIVDELPLLPVGKVDKQALRRLSRDDRR